METKEQKIIRERNTRRVLPTDNNKYSGSDLRKIRKDKGVGRPPKNG